ncbi:MAG: response regulator [Minwuia sp.]|uniref:response regulator n=1 Tax=Minwuia sp. TaxID=2493630 RepID=UPI003A888C5B
MEPKRFIIIDDDRLTAGHAKAVLQKAGHKVDVHNSSIQGLEAIRSERPDAVLTDVMMPDMDGMELTQKLREDPSFDEMKIFVFSGKAFEYDRARAMELGADAYILKPIKAESFLSTVDRILGDRVEVKFWGVRGTLPKPGPNTLRYGGNTSCVTLSFPRGQFFIFDAGSGIREVGSNLLASGKTRTEGKIFISHPHWDHINALPFFAPLFIPGNDYEVLGPMHGSLGIEKLVSEQMSGAYFPITVREFGARVTYRDLREGTYDVGGLQVKTMLLSHPGYCLGYRVDYGGRSVCYITDNEMFLPDSDYHSPGYMDQLADFVRGTEMLITDTTYTDEEYRSKVGWGHSCLSQVVELACRGEVKGLYLFHHDPDQDDDAIDAKHAIARMMIEKRGADVPCYCPAEAETVMV